MKKNDTTYLVLLLFQAIGILMNLIRVLFDALTGTASVVIMYLFSIISPIIVFYLEYKNINCSEKTIRRALKTEKKILKRRFIVKYK